MYTYTIKTDGVEADIEANNIDAAAIDFAEDEFPAESVYGVQDLFSIIERIGDGAWCWIESDDAPDGQRRSANC
jgi:hypothetical protein